MRRLAAVLAATTLVVAACTGGGGDGGKDGKDGPSLPLPDKAPSARGPATGPPLDPKVLLAATDDLEELAGALDTAQVERRSDAFISGKTVVGYSVDDISGYDLDSGEQRWTAKLDLEGGTVCYVSQPDRPVKTFTVVYGDGGYCPELATIRVSDGKVLNTSSALSESLQEFEGQSAGGPVNHLFTVGGKDFLVDNKGVVWKMAKGEPQAVARLEDRSYFQLYPTPDGKRLIGTRLSDRGRCRIDGYVLPSFEHAWTTDGPTVFPDAAGDCIQSAAPGNPAWIVRQSERKGDPETDQRYFMAQLDPKTGEVLGRRDAPKMSDKQLPKGEFELSSAANQFDKALGLPGGDTVFAQVHGLTRFSLKTGKVVWDLDLDQLELQSDEDFPLTDVLPQGVTDDGYLVATVSNDTAAEVVAIDVKKGTLVGRWAVPQEYRNGFQVEPGMTLFDGGLVLTRNFEQWEYTFADYSDLKPPKGDRYDIGVFTFPEPDAKRSVAVPTAGPVDVDAKALGALKTPKGGGDRNAGAIDAGAHLVAYAGNTLTGFEAKSGTKKWTLDVGDDTAARVCATGRPDRKVKTVTIGVREGGKDAGCDTLLRISAKDGKILHTVSVPGGVARVLVHEGVVHVVTGDAKVSRFSDGELEPVGKLAHQPYSFARTPEDPSLVIATASLRNGRDWAVDAYRLPSFERVWSTKASTVLGKVDRRSPVMASPGNGLVLSTTLGDLSSSKGVKDTMAVLDPATGRVAARTGAVKRDYTDHDLRRFDVSDAVVGAYSAKGFEDGDLVITQDAGIIRYSLRDKKIRWALDTTSITESMERGRGFTSVDHEIDLIDGGKTVLVTLSNDTSVELMTLQASSGKLTGRWNVPKASRNGLQASPDVTPFGDDGVALVRNDYSWDYAFRQQDREVPPEQQHDVGLFRLSQPKD